MQSFCRALKTPFLVAGGLTPENVAEAIRILRPHGVDVSGGVESGGEKDIEKIDRFIRVVRAAERNDAVAGKDITG
jgi:phosphoribosylanthranilate isomerase